MLESANPFNLAPYIIFSITLRSFMCAFLTERQSDCTYQQEMSLFVSKLWYPFLNAYIQESGLGGYCIAIVEVMRGLVFF